jgi:HlyD family secretion protein
MKKFFKIVGIILLSFIVLGTFWFLYKKSQPKVVRYEIVEAKNDTIENTSVATGSVSPRDEILIKPQISGIITEILKQAGQNVQAGEVIARVKVIPDISVLNSAESQVNTAQINFNQTKSAYDRQSELFKREIIAKEEMEASEAEYKRAAETLENAKNNFDIVRSGISKKTAQYSNTQIRSTITGKILDIPVKMGNSVIQANTFNDGTTIASVANMNDMIFIGKIDETVVGRIRVGMPIKISVGAIENQKFNAVLEYVSPKGVTENGAILFEIKAAVRFPDSIYIRAGYSANAEIILAKAESVLAIPESAIEFNGDTAFVYILKDTIKKIQIFDKKQIKIGMSDGINVEVKSGLKSGEKIRGNETMNIKK